MHIGLIGFGSIGRGLHARLSKDPAFSFSTLTRSEVSAPPEGLVQFKTLDALIAARPDLVVECAGHAAVRDHAARVLGAGVPLLVASLGALADEQLERELRAAAASGSAPLLLPSGAIGGLDLLRAISAEGSVKIDYRGSKPPAAWKGSPAERLVNLDHLDTAAEFFTGSGREAALAFPKNANVVAALALAGPGFDRLRVTLVADPAAGNNRHSYRVTSPVCTFEMTIDGAPSSGNARTSLTTVLSIAEEVRAFAARRPC